MVHQVLAMTLAATSLLSQANPVNGQSLLNLTGETSHNLSATPLNVSHQDLDSPKPNTYPVLCNTYIKALGTSVEVTSSTSQALTFIATIPPATVATWPIDRAGCITARFCTSDVDLYYIAAPGGIREDPCGITVADSYNASCVQECLVYPPPPNTPNQTQNQTSTQSPIQSPLPTVGGSSQHSQSPTSTAIAAATAVITHLLRRKAKTSPLGCCSRRA